jgi:hypothetical protein
MNYASGFELFVDSFFVVIVPSDYLTLSVIFRCDSKLSNLRVLMTSSFSIDMWS